MNFEFSIKNEASRLGFSMVGITGPEPPPHFLIYKDWIAGGFHAGMQYLATERALERREDPTRILPECRSILVLGVHYRPPEAPPQAHRTPYGRVAAYAQGQDYHDLLKPRLEALIDFIEAITGESVPNRWYTDTGPVLERDLGQRAGLGWIGKNTCLIHPQQGSYFLLAEILLGIALNPDPPFATDHCGTCTRCIDACPTQCILPGRTLDAARCISYQTIENKHAIAVDLRTSLGDWVFGCDVCQQVCPWNIRFALPDGDPDLSSRPDTAFAELLSELTITPEAFNRKFKGHPIRRAKRRGYLRNVAVALGNAGDPAGVPALTAALSDREPLVRMHAAWALGQIGGLNALARLNEALSTETEADVLDEIRAAIEQVADQHRPV